MNFQSTDVKQRSRKAVYIHKAAGEIPVTVSSVMAIQTMNQSSGMVAINFITFPYSYKGAVTTKNVYPNKIRYTYENSHD